MKHANDEEQSRGVSRTSPRRWRQSLGGRLPNILIIFSEKPYEIKEILVCGGGGACQVHPSKSAKKVQTMGRGGGKGV